MSVNRKILRLAGCCFALIGIALALTIQQRPGSVRAAQEPWQQRRQISPPPQPTISAPSSPDAPAATITVNTLVDENGTGTNCSLREAMTAANTNAAFGGCSAGSGADTINIGVAGTIQLTGALPAISQGLTINGPGANLLAVRRNTGGDYNIFVINGGITVSFSGLTITNGSTTGDGGGIANFGNLTITDCAITANQARLGGGILSLGGTTNIIRTTISGNTAADGGGLFMQSTNTVTMINSTVSGNTGTILTGGITVLGQFGAPATLTLTNCTVTGNNGVSEGGIATVDNDGTSPTTTNLKNNILANNSLPNLTRIGSMAQVVSQGNNLANDNGSGLLTGSGDLINTNPQLSALGDNGGPTQTHVLLFNSLAINAGNNTGAPATDQRGVGRPQVGTVDIGAVESGLQFYPLPAPVRLLDTRLNATVGCVKNTGPFVNNETRTQAARTVCSGIPSNAVAITGNVTVVPSGPGYITLFPSDATQPTVANSNFNAGEVTNNLFTLGLGAADGAFKIFTSLFTGGTSSEVIIDVTGYYAPPSASGLYFHTLPTPVRLVETRTFSGATGCILKGSKLTGTGNPNADPSLDYVVQGRTPVASPCNAIPATAQVLVGNATTVFPSGLGYLTIYPSDAARPTVASSNYVGADVINGPFAVRLGADGKFKVYTFATTDLVIDILGYYSADATDANGPGQYFNQIPRPVRLLETRTNPADLPGCVKPGIRLESQTTLYNLKATDNCEALSFSAAQAIVGNATVVTPDNAGYMTFSPFNQPVPTVATSNFPAGGAYNRHFFVGLDSTEGKFNISFNMSNPTGVVFKTDLVIDVSGYFAP